jgi:hypothetical protein
MKYSILFAFLLFSTLAIAQPGNPDTPVPFGFLEALIGAGAVYGARKVHKKNKTKNKA